MSEFKLVPARMLLDKETIGAINFHCGDGADGQFGEYADGLLWVGVVTDDDGSEIYGLHLATAEYPEEGSTTLAEFAPPPEISKLEQLTAERDALQQRLNAANQRIDDFAGGECEWHREEDSGIWNSGCGETWSFHEDGPEENGMRFCHSCGKRLVVEVAEGEKDAAWHMNPCKQGHSDVGSAGGVAQCYTCEEKIEAATTQEAFEKWNAYHTAASLESAESAVN